MNNHNDNDKGMMRGIRVILVKGITEEDHDSFYLEAGGDDGVTRFDHHNEFAGNPALCVDDRIKRIPDRSKVKFTHSDADTLLAFLKMLGLSQIVRQDLIDLELLGKIDANGATILPDLGLDDPTRQFMVGVSVVSGNLGFPRWNGEDVDVTEIVEEIIYSLMDTENVIQLGKEKMIQGKEAYQRCKGKTFTGGKVILLCIESPEDSFDGNLALVDGYEAAVIYSKRRESISLRVRSDADLQISGKSFGDASFRGHKRASGSIFGEKYTMEQAKVVRGVLEHLLKTVA